MARRSRADTLSISQQADRGWYLHLLERTVCAVFEHQGSVLHYDTFEEVEAWDPDAEEFYTFPRDTKEPYLGCMRCLAEVPIPLPPPVPVDIVDWQ